MRRVKSLDSEVFIHRLDMANALKRAKTMLNMDRSIAYASTLEEALTFCGWNTVKDDEGNIISLTYNSNHWRAEAEGIINAIAKWPLEGSFIVMADERHTRYWRWEFNGTQFPSKKILKKEIMDFDSKENLTYLFDRTLKGLLNKGMTLQELHEMLDKYSVNIVMDAIEL